jgi:hypothetical protein
MVYSNNPQSLEEMKDSAELLPTLTRKHPSKVALNTLKGRMLVFEKVVDIFNNCYKAIMYVLRNK